MSAVTSAATTGTSGAGRRGGMKGQEVATTPTNSSWRGRFLRQTSRPSEAVIRATQPFENQTPVYGVIGWTRSILLFPLAALRVLLILLLLLVLGVYFGVVRCCCGRCLRRKPNGAPAPAAFLLTPLRWASRCLLFCFGYVWIDEVYPRGTPVRQRLAFCCCSPSYLRRADVPSVLVPTHHSFMDSLIIVSRVLPSVVGKAAIVRMPIVGPIIAALDPILVPRTPEEKASLPPVLDAIMDRARAGVAEGDARPRGAPVLIFPEGTTVNQRHVITFQHGAFVPGVPVQPICIAYPFCALDVSIPPHVPNWRVLLRQLACLYNRATITYLPPQDPPAAATATATSPTSASGARSSSPPSPAAAPAVSPKQKLSPAAAGLFAKIVRAKMASALGRSLAPHTDRDALLVAEARDRHADLGAYTVSRVLPSLLTRDMESALRVALRMPALASFVDAFARCDSTGDGYLRPRDLRTWAACLLIPTARGRAFRELLPAGGRGGTLPPVQPQRSWRKLNTTSSAASEPGAVAATPAAIADGMPSATPILLAQAGGSSTALPERGTAGMAALATIPLPHSGYVDAFFAALEAVRVQQQQANAGPAAPSAATGAASGGSGRPSGPPLLLARSSSEDGPAPAAVAVAVAVPEWSSASGAAASAAVADPARGSTRRDLLSPLDLFTAFSLSRHGVPIPQGEEGVGLAHWTHMLPSEAATHEPLAPGPAPFLATAVTDSESPTSRATQSASAAGGSSGATTASDRAPQAGVTEAQLSLAVSLLSFTAPGVVDASLVAALLRRQAEEAAPSASSSALGDASAGRSTGSGPATLSGAKRAAAALPAFLEVMRHDDESATSASGETSAPKQFTASQLMSWRNSRPGVVQGVVVAASELLWAAWGLGSRALEPARAGSTSSSGTSGKPRHARP